MRSIDGHDLPGTSVYLERAMLLWPRLDRTRLSRFGDDPARIAEIVQSRTSQPYAAIRAMLTKGFPEPMDATADDPIAEVAHLESARANLRVVDVE